MEGSISHSRSNPPNISECEREGELINAEEALQSGQTAKLI
jgi:hypothetical protein